MPPLAREIRYACRAFLRTPGFTLAAVLSLAIGVAANTAIFSVASALLLKSLPYADPDRLVILWNRSPGLGISEDWFSTAQYLDLKRNHHGFDELAIAIGSNYNLTGDGEPERIGTIRVSSNLLPLLGARAAHGRLFDAADDRPGRTGTAVLHYATWMRRYGGDPRVDRPVDHAQRSAVRDHRRAPRLVLPAPRGHADTGRGRRSGDPAAAALSRPHAAELRNREDYNIIGRLKPGVAIAQAQAEADAITARLRREHPDIYPPNGGLTFSIVPLRDQVVGDIRSMSSTGCRFTYCSMEGGKWPWKARLWMVMTVSAAGAGDSADRPAPAPPASRAHGRCRGVKPANGAAADVGGGVAQRREAPPIVGPVLAVGAEIGIARPVEEMRRVEHEEVEAGRPCRRRARRRRRSRSAIAQRPSRRRRAPPSPPG